MKRSTLFSSLCILCLVALLSLVGAYPKQIGERFSTSDYRIVIPTLTKYAYALDMLLQSLSSVGVPKEKVVLVYASESRNHVYHDERGYLRVNLDRNLYEYNAFFGIRELYRSGYLVHDVPTLLLHDTCKVLPEFPIHFQSMLQRYVESGKDLLWMSATGQFNICIFGARATDAVCARLGHYTTMDKYHAIQMEHNWAEESIKRYPEITQGFVESHNVLIDRRDVYGNGIERVVSLMPALQVEKYYVHVDPQAPQGHPHQL